MRDCGHTRAPAFVFSVTEVGGVMHGPPGVFSAAGRAPRRQPLYELCVAVLSTPTHSHLRGLTMSLDEATQELDKMETQMKQRAKNVSALSLLSVLRMPQVKPTSFFPERKQVSYLLQSVDTSSVFSLRYSSTE